MNDITNNIFDVALVFEGGGMRGSYTAGALVALLENEMYFDAVYGISAGTSHLVNYVSRQKRRAKACFVDLVLDPQFGGVRSALSGKGFFNAKYLYEDMIAQAQGTGSIFEHDWETFAANPCHVHLEAFDAESGECKVFTREDITDSLDLAKKVRASSSLPLFMPATEIDGHIYFDGGLCENMGICIREALADGYSRAVVIRTQPKGYRKKPLSLFNRLALRVAYRKYPKVAEQAIARPAKYNEICEEIERLEEEGRVLVFYPETMPISNHETDYDKLAACYDMGYEQGRRFVEELRAWLPVNDGGTK